MTHLRRYLLFPLLPLLCAGAHAAAPNAVACAKRGDVDCIKRAVARSKDALFAKDAQDNTLLIAAAGGGHNNVIRYVVSQWPVWAPVNKDGYNALHAAIGAGYISTAFLVVRLARTDPDLNFQNFLNAREIKNLATPLHLAAARCERQLYALLVSAGANPVAPDIHRRTPQAILAGCPPPKAKKAPAPARGKQGPAPK